MTVETVPIQGRAIGAIGSLARVVVGVFLVGVSVWGPGWWGGAGLQWHEPVLGLVGFPVLILVGQLVRLRFSTDQLRATNEIGLCVNIAIAIGLFAIPFTRDATALFYGSSMLVAALRGYSGCEVTAISNWLLRRDDQVGCVVFSPVDAIEAQVRRGIGAGSFRRAGSSRTSNERRSHANRHF